VDAQGARAGGQALRAPAGDAGLQAQDLLRHRQPPARAGLDSAAPLFPKEKKETPFSFNPISSSMVGRFDSDLGGQERFKKFLISSLRLDLALWMKGTCAPLQYSRPRMCNSSVYQILSSRFIFLDCLYVASFNAVTNTTFLALLYF
jgi:hypothetical protein